MEGFVQAITFNGKAYNAKINDSWLGCGFKEPTFKEGDYISFTITQNGKWKNLDQESVKQLPPPANKGPTTQANSRFISNDDRQRSIVYQSSRTAALEVLKYLIDKEVIKWPTKKLDQEQFFLMKLDELTIELATKALSPDYEASTESYGHVEVEDVTEDSYLTE